MPNRFESAVRDRSSCPAFEFQEMSIDSLRYSNIRVPKILHSNIRVPKILRNVYDSLLSRISIEAYESLRPCMVTDVCSPSGFGVYRLGWPRALTDSLRLFFGNHPRSQSAGLSTVQAP